MHRRGIGETCRVGAVMPHQVRLTGSRYILRVDIRGYNRMAVQSLAASSLLSSIRELNDPSSSATNNICLVEREMN